jgi:hypothetical protein
MEDAMHDEARYSNLPRVAALHPAVYRALTGSLVWTVASFAALFSTDGEAAFNVGLVAFCGAAFLAVPYWLKHIADAGRIAPEPRPLPLREWLDARFEIPGGTVAAREAAMLILLAPVTLAAALTAISVIRFVVARGA